MNYYYFWLQNRESWTVVFLFARTKISVSVLPVAAFKYTLAMSFIFKRPEKEDYTFKWCYIDCWKHYWVWYLFNSNFCPYIFWLSCHGSDLLVHFWSFFACWSYLLCWTWYNDSQIWWVLSGIRLDHDKYLRCFICLYFGSFWWNDSIFTIMDICFNYWTNGSRHVVKINQWQKLLIYQIVTFA